MNIVILTIIITMGGQDFTRSERMPDLIACWAAAPLAVQSVLDVHQDAEEVSAGCTLQRGKPA